MLQDSREQNATASIFTSWRWVIHGSKNLWFLRSVRNRLCLKTPTYNSKAETICKMYLSLKETPTLDPLSLILGEWPSNHHLIESSFLPTKNSLTEPRCGKKAKQYDGESCCSTRMRLPIPAHVSPTRWSSLTFHPQISSCGQDRQGNQNVQQMKIAEGHRHVLNAPGRGRLNMVEATWITRAERKRWVKNWDTPKMGGFDAQKRPEMLGPGVPDLFSAI